MESTVTTIEQEFPRTEVRLVITTKQELHDLCNIVNHIGINEAACDDICNVIRNSLLVSECTRDTGFNEFTSKLRRSNSIR